ncbi:MAG: metallophosphoesterase family protein [bacterium]
MDIKRCLAIVSDIHCNADALDRCIAKMNMMGLDNPKKIVHLGDAVGYGAKPKEVLRHVRTFGLALKGNHEDYLHAVNTKNVNPNAIKAIEFNKTLLSEEDIAWLTSLPDEQTISTQTGHKIKFAHYAPVVDYGYVENKADVEKSFAGVPEDVQVMFVGHTHKAALMSLDQKGRAQYLPGDDLKKTFGWDKEIQLDPDQRYIINVGSVGQPRDGDPRASFVLYDMAEHSIKFVRVDYSIEKTQGEIREAGLPAHLSDRLAKGE